MAGFLTPASAVLASRLHLFPRPAGTHSHSYTHAGLKLYTSIYFDTHRSEEFAHHPEQLLLIDVELEAGEVTE